MDSGSHPAIRQVDGRLMVEGVSAAELAERFGTPLYVMSEAQLRANIQAWQRGAGRAPGRTVRRACWYRSRQTRASRCGGY